MNELNDIALDLFGAAPAPEYGSPELEWDPYRKFQKELKIRTGAQLWLAIAVMADMADTPDSLLMPGAAPLQKATLRLLGAAAEAAPAHRLARELAERPTESLAIQDVRHLWQLVEVIAHEMRELEESR